MLDIVMHNVLIFLLVNPPLLACERRSCCSRLSDWLHTGSIQFDKSGRKRQWRHCTNGKTSEQNASIRDGAASHGQVRLQPLAQYQQHHRNAQPAGVGPFGHAQSQYTPVHDVPSCSYAGKGPLDSLADIRATHHSGGGGGVPCLEIYSNINITRRL